MIVVPAPPLRLEESVSVSLTVPEKGRVRDAAESSGLSMSAWVRQAILSRLRG